MTAALVVVVVVVAPQPCCGLPVQLLEGKRLSRAQLHEGLGQLAGVTHKHSAICGNLMVTDMSEHHI